MPFTVQDFQALLQLLDQHPEWQAELRRRLLPDELLELPALMRRLTERVEALAAAQTRTEERVEALGSQVLTLVSQIATLASQISSLASQVSTMGGHVGNLRGEALQRRYERRYPAYFGKIARRLRLVEPSRFADLLDDAVDDGRISLDQREEALRADLVLTGRQKADNAQVYFVVEVSVGIGLEDVGRARARAEIVRSLGQPAVPVVAGEWINPEAEDMARVTGVTYVLHPQPAPPSMTAA